LDINKLFDKKIGAFYSKDRKKKIEFANQLIKYKRSKNEINQVIYYAPRKLLDTIKDSLKVDVNMFPYEGLRNTNKPYTMATEKTLLILENVARYKNVSSYIFKRLAKLSKYCKQKFLIDIIPFSTDIQYLYLPWSYLERSVIGHQHYYAFRENNYEKTKTGQIVRSHNFKHLASKLASYTIITYNKFMTQPKEIVNYNLTEKENQGYQKKKEKLFKKYNNPQPIITRLADYTNTRQSGYLKLANFFQKLKGNTIIYTNLKKHNKELSKLFKTVRVRTYYTANGDEGNADNVILFETPIVKGYLFLDVISNLRPDCNIYIFKSDAKVDGYLYRKMRDEYKALNEFTLKLKEAVDKWQETNSIYKKMS
jgi:hypothetical protein